MCHWGNYIHLRFIGRQSNAPCIYVSSSCHYAYGIASLNGRFTPNSVPHPWSEATAGPEPASSGVMTALDRFALKLEEIDPIRISETRFRVESCRNELAKAAFRLGYPVQRQVSPALRTLTDRSASGHKGRGADVHDDDADHLNRVDSTRSPPRAFGKSRDRAEGRAVRKSPHVIR